MNMFRRLFSSCRIPSKPADYFEVRTGLSLADILEQEGLLSHICRFVSAWI
jgi:hypothetical protein